MSLKAPALALAYTEIRNKSIVRYLELNRSETDPQIDSTQVSKIIKKLVKPEYGEVIDVDNSNSYPLNQAKNVGTTIGNSLLPTVEALKESCGIVAFVAETDTQDTTITVQDEYEPDNKIIWMSDPHVVYTPPDFICKHCAGVTYWRKATGESITYQCTNCHPDQKQSTIFQDENLRFSS